MEGKKSVQLFDVDGTVTPCRRTIGQDMHDMLTKLSEKYVIAFVGGSDLVKQKEQLLDSFPIFEYKFSENGVVAFKDNDPQADNSIAVTLGEPLLKRIINFCLGYISTVDVPVKRGHFIEYRKGMLNISPVGRDCSMPERADFEVYDKEHLVRQKFVQAIRTEFPEAEIEIAIGGQISFDLFPKGWNKTYCLRYLESYEEIFFFGDKCFPGGNDYEIYCSDRIKKSYAVSSPEDTLEILKKEYLW